MVLNKYRSTADKILVPIAKIFSGLHPNTITAVSLVFAFLAGIALVFADKSRFEDIFFPGHYIYIMFIIASVCIFLNGFFDAVDGKVAQLTKRMSKRGDLFDHTLDRYSDILIIGGIMLSPFCDSVIGALAIIAVLMVSYMGTQAQALGCGRNYSGLLGRADRIVILILAPVFQMWVLYYFPNGRIPLQYVSNFTLLEWIMIWFIIAGNITAIHRGIHSWRELRDMDDSETGGQSTLDDYMTLLEHRRRLSQIRNLNIPVKGQTKQEQISRTYQTPLYASTISSTERSPTPPQLVRSTMARGTQRRSVPGIPRSMVQAGIKGKARPSRPPKKPEYIKPKQYTKPKTLPERPKPERVEPRPKPPKPAKTKTKTMPKKPIDKPKPERVKLKTKPKKPKEKLKEKPKKMKLKTKTKPDKPISKPKGDKTKKKTTLKKKESEIKPEKTKLKTKPLKTKTKAKPEPKKTKLKPKKDKVKLKTKPAKTMDKATPERRKLKLKKKTKSE